tara:strand:- start:1111 stop:1395 length:285 start_codon:yes stop_codon:yes gene_type:complete
MQKVKCIRLNTGEVIMGFVEKLFLGDYIITEPQIILTTAENNKMEVNFAPWIPYAKEYKFKIKHQVIQSVFDPKPQLETNFKVATGNRGIRGQK